MQLSTSKTSIVAVDYTVAILWCHQSGIRNLPNLKPANISHYTVDCEQYWAEYNTLATLLETSK